MITLHRIASIIVLVLLVLLAYAFVNGQGQNFPIVTPISCGTAVACTNSPQNSVKVVYGSAPLTSASPSTATLTGLPFSTSTSYFCTGTEQTTSTNTVKFANASASSTVITGPNTVTDVIAYVCVGT